MLRSVPYIIAGEQDAWGSTQASGSLSTAKQSGNPKNSRIVDRWNYKESYHGIMPYCVGNMTGSHSNTNTQMSLKVGIEHGDKSDGSDFEELIQHANLTPHTTIYPNTNSTAKRYFETNATPWDLRRAKRYVRAYVVPTFASSGANDARRFNFHVGLAMLDGDDQPPTNPTVA